MTALSKRRMIGEILFQVEDASMPFFMFFRFLLVYARGNLGKSAAMLLTIIYLANLNNFTPSFVKTAFHQPAVFAKQIQL